MAVSIQDHFWADVFRDIRVQTDAELGFYNEVDSDNARLYVSPLVEPQLARKDFYTSLEQAHEKERKLLAHLCVEQNVSASWKEASAVSFARRTIIHQAINDLIGKVENSEAIKAAEKICCQSPLETEHVPCSLKLDSNTLSAVQGRTSDGNESGDGATKHSNGKLFDTVSSPYFAIDDLPADEVRRRLNAGEIAPREEWIPSEDPKNKKNINKSEFEARKDFSDMLEAQAKKALAEDNMPQALTVYSQGVNLWNVCTTKSFAEEVEISELLAKFRRNRAVVALKLESYHTAIDDDEHDGKAMILRGRAYLELGDTDKAMKDFERVSTDAHCDEEHRQVGLKAKVLVRHKLAKDKKKVQTLMQNVADTNLWSENRPMIVGEDRPATSLQSYEQTMQTAKNVVSADAEDTPLTAEELEEIMIDMLRLYTVKVVYKLCKHFFLQSPNVSKDLEIIRHQCEYDEKKIIVKLQKFLPPLLEPHWAKTKLGSLSPQYSEMKEIFDKCVRHYRMIDKHSTVFQLATKLREALVGGDEVTG